MAHAFNYYAIIERPDGSTYEQGYDDFYDLLDLIMFLGRKYRVVEVY